MALTRRLVVLVALVIAPAVASAKPSRVVVWPQDPGDDVAAAEAAVREAGHEVAAFAAIGGRIEAQAAARTRAQSEALAKVQAGLAAARAAYLKQDFAAMASGLAALEAAALPALAIDPKTLWEVELQRGLAELGRRDAAAARRYFAFALELDETTPPRRDLYGPDVLRAYTEAADARAGVPPRPVAIRVTPPDARVVIDGVPVIDNKAPRNLRPGLHVVHASAPGHRTSAQIVDAGTAPIAIALDAAPGELLGIDAGRASSQRAIRAVLTEVDASVALVVDVDARTGEATARLVTATEASPAERGATAAAAARAALAYLDERGGIGRGPTKGGGSIVKRWWFWTALAGAAAVAVGVTYAATRDPGGKLIVRPPLP